MSSVAERGVAPGGIGADRRDRTSDIAMGGVDTQPPQKKKQKRNKPTLSCVECVERKTKTRSTKIRKDKRNNGNDSQPTSAAADPPFPGLPSPTTSFRRSGSTSSTNSSPFLLSNLQHTRQVSVSVFGSGTAHPFANYWTTSGGVPEVIGVLPSKEQADSLITKYFECVDPVYPMINKAHFMTDYDRFWALSLLDKQKVDPSMLGLHYAVYAMGAQFVQLESQQTRAQIAEFYVSAAHQSLRLYPYLSRTSLRTIQAMVLMKYFLMNDNKPTDAWAFGGLISRQAYAMGLNRDPERIVPEATLKEKNARCKTWQAVYWQDTFFTVLLKLPPTTSYTDCTVDSLKDEPIDPHLPRQPPQAPTHHPAPPRPQNQTPMLLSPLPINTNPMSISNIAPRHSPPPNSSSTSGLPPGRHTDLEYIRCMWRMADLVQVHICTPQALSAPLAISARDRATLVSRFHTLYASFPTSLTTTKRSEFALLLADGGRMARQNLFLRSNFWHCIMLIEADESEARGYGVNVEAAIRAGMTAVHSFFDFWDFLRNDASVWWVFQHRAFEEALTISNLLAAYGPHPGAGGKVEALFQDAREDVRRMLEIVEHVGNTTPEMKKTRTEALRASLENIQW